MDNTGENKTMSLATLNIGKPILKCSRHFSQFSRSLWLTALTFVGLASVFIVYVLAEKQIDRANELRLQSHLLIDEFRQSSDDLSLMTRSYVVTGDSVYKQYFQQILDIRDGKKPRPIDYHDIYWDLVLADGLPPRPDSGQAVALLELMRRAEFTEQEFAKMAEAKANSDTLTNTEYRAMALVDSGLPTEEARVKASMLLQDQAYHRAKAKIMAPISEAYQMVDSRTLLAVQAKENAAAWLRGLFAAFAAMFLIMLRRVYRALNMTLGASVDDLHGHIVRLGSGDFSEPMPVGKGLENSVMAWLSETRLNLARLDADHREAEAKNQRMTQLYAALSQCNQAIVRCNNEAELFPQICQDAVIFGGMKMAWIGMLDESSRLIKPVAFYGQGTEYLDGIQISIDENLPVGRGPTGSAVREDRPFWCQDFQHDPCTVPWRERGATFGWKASASLPLHRNGIPVGSFTLYASIVDAFDEAACNLLVEMAMDIDHALKGFERERERLQAQQMESFRMFVLEHLNASMPLMDMLAEVVEELEVILAGSLCSILLLDAAGEHLRLGAAPSLPDFYNRAIDGMRIGAGVGSCGNTAFTGKRTIVDNIAQHPYWAPYKLLAEQAGLSACWSEPIRAADGTILGTFAIYQRQPSLPDMYALRLLEMAAHLVALAIERKRAEEHIYHLANYDPLTGLPNRGQLNDHLKYALSLAKRSNGHLTLMFLDLDHFKDINDTLGHSTGDALLVELAKRLRLVLRDEDTLTRLGGDEFIFLLPGTNAHGATYVAQKLLDTIAAPYRIEHYDLTLTASIGIALYPEDGEDLETLSKSADSAMYRAKLEGRHGYRFFTQEMHARSARNLQLVNALRQALDRDQLSLHYQPQLAMQDGRMIGAEALLRWRHPELGMVSPAEFIPVAEESGLILPIGEWVLRTAVRQAKSWMDRGFEPLIMAVNLSAVQFRHPSLPDLITRVLDEEGVPPEYLELELTEGVAMQDPEGAIAVMNNLHQLGIRMSIDDFGTGYSSLNYLKKFKVYKLKIDQSFVRDICADADDKAIVAAVIGLAGSLGLRTIAEGVETTEQQALLRDQGCDEMQGYLFSKPVPSEQFEAFLTAITDAVR